MKSIVLSICLIIPFLSFAQPSSKEAIEKFKADGSNAYLKQVYNFSNWSEVTITPLKWSNGKFWSTDDSNPQIAGNIQIHIPKKYNKYEVIQPMQIVYNKTRDGYEYRGSRQDSPKIIGYEGASNEEKIRIVKNAIFNPKENYIIAGIEKYIKIDSISVLGIADILTIGSEEWKFIVYGEEALLDNKKDTYSKTRFVKHKITLSVKKSSGKWEVTRLSLPKMTFGRTGEWIVYEGDEYYGTYKKTWC